MQAQAPPGGGGAVPSTEFPATVSYRMSYKLRPSCVVCGARQMAAQQVNIVYSLQPDLRPPLSAMPDAGQVAK
jgi:hypothetical protein